MGCDARRARSAIRFSLGRFTTAEEIDYVTGAVGAAVDRLRTLSPLRESDGTVSVAVDWAALP